MRITEELALVVELACLTEDRTKAEQRALVNTARRLDRERNKQSTSNPRLADTSWPPPPCTYSDDHTKECICRGDGYAWEPKGGWSRLVGLVESTWEPSQ